MNDAPSDQRAPGSETDRWIERAARVMSSRQSNVRALPEPSIFLDRGQGQRVWDVDGREYLDFAIAMGPGIWGHGNREYLDVIHEQLEKLVYVQSGACQSRLEVELAEKLVEHIPSAERVRFHLSGSEAVQMTLRLSRAFTGRPLFVRFAGHYHGWLDNVVGGVMNSDLSARPHALASEQDPFFTAGKAAGALQESFLLPWNDIDALERVLEKYASEIAVVMMEVFNSNGGGCPPRPGYLERARELCLKHGVLLCFDEIITGFRTALGGAQSIVGVTPDLSIFGKAIAGGMPLAAIAGRRDVFEQFRTNRVIGAGTFNAFPVAMAAGLATVRLLARDGGAYYRARDRVQDRLTRGLRTAAARHGHSLLVQGMPGNFCTHFTPATTLWNHSDFALVDTAKAVRFRALLREEGVIQGLGSRWFVSFAFTEADCDETLERADRAFARLG
jgi:glutamate-1-semialdehyde 2,1-aminomutase